MPSSPPIPKWYEVVNNVEQQALSWNAGTVDAGSYSDEKEFWIWNNKGGGSAVSDMTNVTLTTKDVDGYDLGKIASPNIEDRDAEVQVSVYDGELDEYGDFNAVYGSSQTIDLVSASGELGVIAGAINDGNRNTTASKANFARVKLKLRVYETADAGAVSWKTRVSYQYT
jgi:hypothetical protein